METRVGDGMATTGVVRKAAAATTRRDHVTIAMTVDDVPVIERIHAREIPTGVTVIPIPKSRSDVRADVAIKPLIVHRSTMATFPLGIRPSRLL
jgi:hypothetical protein